MVHSFKNRVLIWSLKTHHFQQVKPEIFKLVWVEINQLKVLCQADDHLVECKRTFRVLLDVLWIWLGCWAIGCLSSWGSAVCVWAHMAVQQIVLVYCLEYELLLDLSDYGQYLINEEVEQTLRIYRSVKSPLSQNSNHWAECLHEFATRVLCIIEL